jgi:hypothetical protein
MKYRKWNDKGKHPRRLKGIAKGNKRRGPGDRALDVLYLGTEHRATSESPPRHIHMYHHRTEEYIRRVPRIHTGSAWRSVHPTTSACLGVQPAAVQVSTIWN